MKLLANIHISILLFSITALYAQDSVQFSSSHRQSSMIELFTSQGCSSCPPAERWLNAFIKDNQLWEKVVPIAFHVDYWDRLGWPDPYANHAHSMRQYRYQQQGHLSSVYTPGVLVNGTEWRGWIRGKTLPQSIHDAGKLAFKANSKQIEVEYSNASKDTVLNVALLGSGINTKVERGENRDKVLRQDFVVLSHDMYSFAKIDSSGVWKIPMLIDSFSQAEQYALVVWVSDMNDIAPIQSTGYWLPEEWFK